MSNKETVVCEGCCAEHQPEDDRRELHNVFYLVEGLYFCSVNTFCKECLKKLFKNYNNRDKSHKKSPRKRRKNNDKDIPFK